MTQPVLAAILGPLLLYALAVPMPGPGFAVILRAGLSDGPGAARAAAFATTMAASLYAIASLAGLSALFLAWPSVSAAISCAAGAYLIWLGLSLAHSLAAPERPRPRIDRPETGERWFRRALLIGLGNPKMAGFFLALFAPATSPDLPLSARLTVLAGVILIDGTYHQVLARAAASGAVKALARPLEWLAAGLMTTLGLGLLWTALSGAQG